MNKSVKLEELFPIIEEQLANNGSAVFTIHGTSMEPLLKDRTDSVRITSPTKMPRKYDIIFYRRDNGRFILHRIVDVKPDGFVCRGDNHIDNEYPVKFDSIIGIVSDYNSGGKWKSVSGFRQKIYAFLWVNLPILCKLKGKLYFLLKKKDR